ncbi:hypothetical protein TWF730_000266 [Orbilia blumenaviensis]|uniref:Uncharacterized protein n=1 Tax=Orbilia blumenaviensis TaxID=1796055 RepID=A0AAV9VNA3_9PEZI
MATMLKRILKGRDRTSKDYSNPSFPDQTGFSSGGAPGPKYHGGPNTFQSTTSSAVPVDYEREQPGYSMSPTSDTQSPFAVDYDRIRPDVDPSFYGAPPRPPQQTYGKSKPPPAVRYNQPAPKDPYPAFSSNPVDYESTPTAPSGRMASAQVVEYDKSPPRASQYSEYPQPTSNGRMGSAQVVEYNKVAPRPSQYSDYPPAQPKDSTATYSPAVYKPDPPPPAPKTDRMQGPPTYSPAVYKSDPPPTAPDTGRTLEPRAYGLAQYELPATAPQSLVSPAVVDYTRQAPVQSPYAHEMAPPSLASPAMVSYGQTPAGGYLSINSQMQSQPQNPAQQYPSYGNFGENAANQRPPYNYQEHYAPSGGSPTTPKYAHLNEAQKPQPRFENNHSESGNSSASSLYSPPFSATSNSTAPTSVYSFDRPNFIPNTPNTPSRPNLPPRNPQATSSFGDSTATSADDPNVSKFVVRLFCQRKREEGDTHEESPRDIREFRLANLALIKLAAGAERYVLLDAVFGELDKAIAPLLEKHWYLTLNTTVEDHFVPGGKHVVAIGKVMVAYKGTQSTIYADFKKDEDYARFKMEMEYAMNTIRNSTSANAEKPKYRY